MMKDFLAGVAAIVLLSLNSCAASRITDYLSGFPESSAQVPPASVPIRAGLVLAIPETESGKPTAPNPAARDKLTERIQKGLQNLPRVQITRVMPAIILPGDGLKALSLERLREAAKDAQMDKLFVVVATSRSAQRVQPYPIIETEVFARLDLALVDLAAGRVLLSEAGEEDYILGQRRDVERTISYPRIYYRTQTTTGPFLVVEGDRDPFAALGEVAFAATADQLLMRLREKL